MYDVIIIGAGPAGTAAGYFLGGRGLSVLVLDRKQFPRKKACAGGITPKAMALYPFDISCFVRRVCREMKITRPGNTSFIVKSDDPLCYITNRMDLDTYCLDKAVQAGCRFEKIDRLTGLDQNDRGVFVHYTCDGKPQIAGAAYLIGADGANSNVRRLIGARDSGLTKLPALEADVPVKNAGLYPMEFDFSRDICGYYWIFPRKTHVNIGIFSARPNGTMNRALLTAYARERLNTGILKAVKGYPIAVSGGKTSLGSGRVLLAGDAAGLAEPLFGEGIYPALKSGLLCAQAITNAGNQKPGGPAYALARYRQSLGGLKLDLGIYRCGASILYRYPKWSLAAGSCSILHNCFSKGYSRGKTLHEILFPF